jgi:hypothetical protein
MTLLPGRFDYAPINDRPIIKWPNNARVAFWVAPNMGFFEYLPKNRPSQPDIPHYSRMDYGNRVGFWRMLDVLNKHRVRACCCLNLEILDHFPEIKDAMVAADWDYMAHGLYNSRPIYDLTEEQERAYWQDFISIGLRMRNYPSRSCVLLCRMPRRLARPSPLPGQRLPRFRTNRGTTTWQPAAATRISKHSVGITRSTSRWERPDKGSFPERSAAVVGADHQLIKLPESRGDYDALR